MKQIIADYRTSEVTKAELVRLGFSVIETKPISKLYNEVRGHADMQIHIVNGKAICEPTVYGYYKEALKGVDIVRGGVELSERYPSDIAYNTCGVGNYAICKTEYTAHEILKEYRNMGAIILNTRQGYAKCSLCVIDKNSAITSDNGLYKLLKEHGINILKIREGFIQLGKMNGFIGGASGLIKPNLIAFNGDLRTHPDCENIKSFCRNSGADIVSLNKGPLIDIGSFTAVQSPYSKL